MTRSIVIFAFLVTCHTSFAQDGRDFAVNSPLPDYPLSARQRGFEGSGVFLAHLRRDGTVRSLDLVQSSGHAELDQAARAAYQKWRFAPGAPDKVKLPFTFTMHGIPRDWKIVDTPKHKT